MRTLLKEIGVSSLGVFENESDSDLILRIFDKIRVFSQEKAKKVFLEFQIKNCVQVDIKYVGVIPNTVKLFTFIELVSKKLKVISKPEDLLCQVLIFPFIDWLEQVSNKDQKYKNIVMVENTWWLNKMLDLMSPKTYS